MFIALQIEIQRIRPHFCTIGNVVILVVSSMLKMHIHDKAAMRF